MTKFNRNVLRPWNEWDQRYERLPVTRIAYQFATPTKDFHAEVVRVVTRIQNAITRDPPRWPTSTCPRKVRQ